MCIRDRVVNALGPADIGNVDEAIDAILDLHKRAKSGEAFYLAGEYGSDGEVIFNGKPGVGIHLFHSQGDALVFLVQFQHDGIHRVADLEYLAGIGDLLGPAHFRDAVSYTHLRAHETVLDLVCRLLLEKKKKTHKNNRIDPFTK